MMDKHILIRRLGFAAYFIAAFLVFLLLLFPFDRAKARLESEVRLRTPYELSIARIAPRFFDRVALSDVVLSNKSGKVLFESQSAKAVVSYFGLLRGLFGIELKAQAYGGELLVKVRQGREKEKQYLLVDANSLDVGAYSLLKDLGLKLAGKLGGNFEMSGEAGKGRFWLKGLASRELKIQGFSIPDLDFEQCWLEFDVKGDRMTIKKLEFDGKELKIKGSGDLILRDRGTLNLTLKIKPSERLALEQAAVLSLFRSKDPEGYYQLVLGGTVSEPLPRF